MYLLNIFATKGSVVVQGIRSVWLPGHIPGHTGFRILSGKKVLLIWGVSFISRIFSQRIPLYQLCLMSILGRPKRQGKKRYNRLSMKTDNCRHASGSGRILLFQAVRGCLFPLQVTSGIAKKYTSLPIDKSEYNRFLQCPVTGPLSVQRLLLARSRLSAGRSPFRARSGH